MTDLTSTGPTHAGEGKIWPRTDLLDLLGITHPIIQTPMSGFGGPVLVGAVSNAGALGSLGCGAVPNQTARDQVQEIRRATNRPFSLNFFAHAAPRIIRWLGEVEPTFNPRSIALSTLPLSAYPWREDSTMTLPRVAGHL